MLKVLVSIHAASVVSMSCLAMVLDTSQRASVAVTAMAPVVAESVLPVTIVATFPVILLIEDAALKFTETGANCTLSVPMKLEMAV